MPLPTPPKGERRKKFIESCMANPTMNKDFPENAQRFAVCNSQFDRRRKAKGSDDVDWDDQAKAGVLILV